MKSNGKFFLENRFRDNQHSYIVKPYSITVTVVSDQEDIAVDQTVRGTIILDNTVSAVAMQC